MEVANTLFFALPVCLLSAVITVYIAHMYGRRFWPWFLFGFFVPFIATFISIGLGIWDAKRNERAGRTED